MKLHFERANYQKFVELKKTIAKASIVQQKKEKGLCSLPISEFRGWLEVTTTHQVTSEAIFKRGKDLLLKGDFRRAITELNTFLLAENIEDRSKGEAYFYRGLAYRELKKTPQASQDFGEAKKCGFSLTYPVEIYKLITEGKRMQPGSFKPSGAASPERPLNAIIRKIEEARQAEAFLEEYAKIIWYHRELQDPEEAKTALHEALEDALRPFMALCKGFTDTAKRKIKDIASKELLRIYEKEKINHGRAAGSPYISGDDPLEGPRRVAHEDDAITEIYRLYREFTELSERQIELNMARVFEAVDFWQKSKGANPEKIYELIKKRLKKYLKVSQLQHTEF